MNPFSPNYVSDYKPDKTPPPKRIKNAFDGDDHKARQACVHLPATHPHSRAELIKRGNSKV